MVHQHITGAAVRSMAGKESNLVGAKRCFQPARDGFQLNRNEAIPRAHEHVRDPQVHAVFNALSV